VTLKAPVALQKLCDRILGGDVSSLMNIGSRLLQNANGFLLTAIVAHRYGLDAVGTLTLAAVPITLVALCGTFGLHFRFAQIKERNSVLNSLGLISAVVSLPAILLLAVVFGLAVGHSQEEQFQIAVIALSSIFFSQSNVTNALQVVQNKMAHSIIPPGLNALGLVAGAFSHDFSTFCVCILAFRLLGIAIAYALLPHDFNAAIRLAPAHLRAGTRYLFADAVLVLGDNILILLCSHLLGRSELGVLGICRQLMTASDTPGWASLQSVYPKLVTGDHAFFRRVVRSMLLLSALLGIGVTAVAVPAGLTIFHTPDLWIYTAILMGSAPARYVVVSAEMFLKAKGRIKFANRLSSLRAVAGFAFIGGSTAVGGLVGHVSAFTAFFILCAIVEFAVVLGDRRVRPAALKVEEAI
jgi:hypothetical protein